MSISLARESKSAAVFLILLGLIVAQQISALPQGTQFARALNNAFHAPWFMAVSLGIWYLVDKLFPLNFPRQLLCYSIASTCLAVLVELAQLFSARQASIGDVGLNLLGAFAALLAICSLFAFRMGRSVIAMVLLGGALFTVSAPFYTPWSLLQLQFERARQMPVLLQFNNKSITLLRQTDANWELVSSPEDWREFRGREVGFIHLDYSARWPGIRLIEPVRDWSGYSHLVIDAFSPEQKELLFTARVATSASRGHDQAVDFIMNTGANHIQIPVAKLVGKQARASAEVRALYITSSQRSAVGGIYLGSIALQ